MIKQEEELQQEVSYFDITTWNRLAEEQGESGESDGSEEAVDFPEE